MMRTVMAKYTLCICVWKKTAHDTLILLPYDYLNIMI